VRSKVIVNARFYESVFDNFDVPEDTSRKLRIRCAGFKASEGNASPDDLWHYEWRAAVAKDRIGKLTPGRGRD
jgi:hypothetical protein